VRDWQRLRSSRVSFRSSIIETAPLRAPFAIRLPSAQPARRKVRRPPAREGHGALRRHQCRGGSLRPAGQLHHVFSRAQINSPLASFAGFPGSAQRSGERFLGNWSRTSAGIGGQGSAHRAHTQMLVLDPIALLRPVGRLGSRRLQCHDGELATCQLEDRGAWCCRNLLFVRRPSGIDAA
jgi:hypothetical protein